MNRRDFLRTALAGAGLLGLAAAGLLGRAARLAARTIRIPLKPFDPSRLRDPHDLAG